MADSKYQEILAVAANVIAKRSYHGASLEEIADSVNLRKQSLYHYFPSKQDLLYAILRDSIILGTTELESTVAEASGPLGKLRAVTEAVVCGFRDHNAQWSVYIHEKRDVLRPEQREELAGLEERYGNVLRGVIDEGYAEGVFRVDCDKRMLEFAVLGVLYYMKNWYSPDGRLPAEEISRVFSNFIIGGLKSPDEVYERSSRANKHTEGLGSTVRG